MPRNEHLWTMATLCVLLALAFGSRFLGIDYGQGLKLHPDEPQVLRLAARIVEDPGRPVGFWAYPPALANLISWSMRVLGVAGTESRAVGLIGHYLVAIMGGLSAVLCGATARILGGLHAGLFALALGALSPLWVEHSRYVTTDVPTAFGTALVAYCCARLFSSNQLRWFFFAGLTVGVAGAFKYIGALSALLVVLTYVLSPWSKTRRGWMGIFACGAVAIAAFVLLNHQILPEYARALKGIRREFGHYVRGHGGYSAAGEWRHVLSYLAQFGLGIGATLAAVVGLASARSVKKNGNLLALAGMAVAWLAFLCTRQVFFARNIVHVLPFFAVLAGVGFGVVSAHLRHWTHVGALSCAIFALPAWQTLGFGLALTDPDTRIRASQWMRTHLPAGSTVAIVPRARDVYLPSPRVKGLKLSQRPGYRSFNQLARNYDYLVVPFGGVSRYLREKKRPPEVIGFRRWHRRLRSRKPIAVFVGVPAPGAHLFGSTGDCFHNPRIEIYDLRDGGKKRSRRGK